MRESSIRTEGKRGAREWASSFPEVEGCVAEAESFGTAPRAELCGLVRRTDGESEVHQTR